MTFPHDPVSFSGGCNCGAIRYTVSVPPFAARPIAPYCDEDSRNPNERLPTVMIDHCNDCRRATGAMLPVWLICDIETVSFSIRGSKNEKEKESFAASKLLARESLDDVRETSAPLKTYNSSLRSVRGFCGDCGTMLWYRSRTVFPADWPDMLDVVVGTVDRGDLEREWFVPRRELWWGMGVPWMRRLVWEGTQRGGGERHPEWKVNVKVQGDGDGDVVKGVE